MVKTMLYKRTIALGISIDFGKDLRRAERRGDSGGSGWRKEVAKTGGRIRNITEKTPREILTCDEAESVRQQRIVSSHMNAMYFYFYYCR